MDYTIRGKVKTTPPLTAAFANERYQWLSLDLAEPNLGVGSYTGGPLSYVLVTSGFGQRMWTRTLNLSAGGTVIATTGVFDVLSAANLDLGAGNLGQAVIDALSTYRGVTYIDQIYTRTISAQRASIDIFEKKISLFNLDQSGATVGQVPIWTGFFWVPGAVLEGFAGNRLHEFLTSAFAPGLSADYSYCATGVSGSEITDPVWRITRLRYTDDGLIEEIAVAPNVAWTSRLTATYFTIDI